MKCFSSTISQRHIAHTSALKNITYFGALQRRYYALLHERSLNIFVGNLRQNIFYEEGIAHTSVFKNITHFSALQRHYYASLQKSHKNFFGMKLNAKYFSLEIFLLTTFFLMVYCTYKTFKNITYFGALQRRYYALLQERSLNIFVGNLRQNIFNEEIFLLPFPNDILHIQEHLRI